MRRKGQIRILLTGGGSGGHVYPLLAVADELERIAINERIELQLFYMGAGDRWAEFLKRAGVHIIAFPVGKLRRYASVDNLLDIPRFFVGFLTALGKLFILMPDAVFSKGGTGAFPVVLAAWFYRIPTIIHESDVHPGLTNLLSSFFVTRIAVSFKETVKYFNPRKTAWLGNIIRRDLLVERLTQHAAKEELGFNPEKPLVLVLGGSQGSKRINEFIIENLTHIVRETQVLHQTGEANYAEVKRLSRAALVDVPLEVELKGRYQAVPYLGKDMKTALSAADLVVARAGSGTIFEIAAFGKPAILIPLAESANDHQRANAYAFARAGGAVVIEESNLLSAIFLGQFKELLGNSTRLDEMGKASAAFWKPGAAEIIAAELLRIA